MNPNMAAEALTLVAIHPQKLLTHLHKIDFQKSYLPLREELLNSKHFWSMRVR